MINNTRNINCTTNEFAINTQPAIFEIDDNGNWVTANSMNSVEIEYISQHDDIYPNPTTGKLFIESLTNASDFNNSMKYIYNMYGSIVYSDVIHDEDNNFSIDISKLSKGLYILSIHKISGNSTFKIIIR